MRDEVVHDLRLLVPLRSRDERAGGWRRPNSGSSPPFELKWLAITNSVCPLNVNSPASGLRLAFERRVRRVDAARAERQLRAAGRADDAGRRWSTCRPAGRRTRARGRCGRGSPDADVAAGLAAVLVVDRVDLPVLVGRPAGGCDRRDERVEVTLGVDRAVVRRRRCCPGSPRARRYPATRRLSTISPRGASNFVAASVGARFSTLNVATDELVGGRGRRRPRA